MFLVNVAKLILGVEKPDRNRKQRFKNLNESLLARQGFESSSEEEELLIIRPQDTKPKLFHSFILPLSHKQMLNRIPLHLNSLRIPPHLLKKKTHKFDFRLKIHKIIPFHFIIKSKKKNLIHLENIIPFVDVGSIIAQFRHY